MTFNPEMLILARDAAALSQEDVATAIGISQAKMSKFESGAVEPSDEEVARLAVVFDRPVAFFRQSALRLATGASWFHHRAHRTVGARTLRRVHADLDIVRLELGHLLEGIKVYSDADRGFDPIDLEDYDGNIERVAQTMRARWQIPDGPVESMTAAIERNGGVVVPYDFGTAKIAAMSLFAPGTPPLFYVSRTIPTDRWRWSLAHELGHIVLHDRHPKAEKEMEDEADLFASEFLLPRREITNSFWPPVRLSDLAALKQRWKVSLQALIRCAFRVGKIDEGRYTSLNIEISRNGWKRREPIELPAEKPQFISQVIQAHLQRRHQTPADLADAARTTPNRFTERYLAGNGQPRLVG